MGFKTVYGCLTDVFPQVDTRILKAVAIEHSKDADAAVEIVLLEVLPFLSWEPAVVPSSSGGDGSTVDPSDGEAEHEEQTTGLRHRRASSEKSVASSSEPTLITEEEAGKTDLTDGVHRTDSTSQENGLEEPTTDLDTNQYNGNIESEELILLGEVQLQKDAFQSGSSHTPNAADLMQCSATDQRQVSASDNEVPTSDQHQDINIKVGHEQTPQVLSTSLVQENGGSSVSLTDYHSELNDAFDMAKSSQPAYVDCLPAVGNNSVAGPSPNYDEDCLHTGFCSIPNDNENMISKQYNATDFLDENVEAAKNNKKNLFMAMESIMAMMKEVELQERAAEQAKEEAARGGLDILAKVEELKQLLAHAKEANDMHAGEVYGEKAILATEVRELQARLISLSDERDNALAIIDEMRQSLESRLTVAEELRKAAEQEKMEKEMTARSALAEQEIIMEKVVQESNILQKEAEENAKLREFLMDRGHVVDTLQGEISVICQDVRLLKQNFDQRVPLSKSISSSQTSCILASSGSSVKSMASDPLPELSRTTEPPSQTSPTCSVDGQSSETVPELEKDTAGEQILDDGWDLLEE